MAQTGTASMERTLGAVAMMAIWLAGAGVGMAAEPAVPSAKPAAPPVKQTGEIVVLDSNSLWRHFVVSRCAFARTPDGKLEAWDLAPYFGNQFDSQLWPHMVARPATSTNSSPLPPANWAGVDMEDGAWPRVRLPQPPMDSCRLQTRYGATAALLLRGKFVVRDPAQVKSCRLSLDYLGGVVVYVNGKEAVRRHLPGAKPDLLALAADYPAEAFTTAKGGFAGWPYERDVPFGPELPDWSAAGPPPVSAGGAKPKAGGVALRDRGLRDLDIPASLLRRGVNVLAIEVHTSPLTMAYIKEIRQQQGGDQGGLPWVPIGLLRARLAVAPAAAAVANVTRPSGIQVWNCAAYDTLGVFDFGDPSEPLRQVSIAAARNSAFSGRLVVSSERPIKGLKVTVSDLVQANAKLPAAVVQMRYAEAVVPGELPQTEGNSSLELSQGKSYLPVARFDGLLDTIPAEIPMSRAPLPKEAYYGRPVDRKALIAGAVAPLWFTVRVPKEAKSGVYQGQIAIQAAGLPLTNVPLRVSICDWVTPDAKDFRMCNMPCQYDWILAWRYNVPLWSDKHFDLIGKAHALMSQAAVRQFSVDFIIPGEMDARFKAASLGPGDFGESLIRWIKQPDGSLKHDMTAFDKYLDMIAKSAVKPRPLRLRAWLESQGVGAGSPGDDRSRQGLDRRTAVSVLDPNTGKIERFTTPSPATDGAAALAFWRPVFDDVLKRVKARGWLDATALGWSAFYGGPDEGVAKLAKGLWPDAVWAHMAHEAGRQWKDPSNPWVKVRYAGIAYEFDMPSVRGYRALLEPRPMLCADVYRTTWRDWTPLAHQRRVPEDIAMSGMDGVCDFGADLFPYPARWPGGEGFWAPPVDGNRPSGPQQTQMSMLYPGPDGPVATERFEMFREGVELTEALLFIERALQTKKLSAALQQRAERHLEARSHAFIMDWFAIRDMPAAEDAKLLALAGEVAGEMEGRK